MPSSIIVNWCWCVKLSLASVDSYFWDHIQNYLLWNVQKSLIVDSSWHIVSLWFHYNTKWLTVKVTIRVFFCRFFIGAIEKPLSWKDALPLLSKCEGFNLPKSIDNKDIIAIPFKNIQQQQQQNANRKLYDTDVFFTHKKNPNIPVLKKDKSYNLYVSLIFINT